MPLAFSVSDGLAVYGRWAADAYASAWRYTLNCQIPVRWSKAFLSEGADADPLTVPTTFSECLGLPGTDFTWAAMNINKHLRQLTSAGVASDERTDAQDFLFWAAGIVMVEASYAFTDRSDQQNPYAPNGGANQLRRWDPNGTWCEAFA